MKLLKEISARGVRWMWKLVPDCAEMSRLASLSFDQPLAFGTRLKMRLHYLICVWCQRYRKQIAFLRRATQYREEHLHETDHRLSEQSRERLKRALRDECH